MTRSDKISRRLAECIIWCEQVQQKNDSDPASIFRSPVLKPPPSDWERDRLLAHWKDSPGQPGLVDTLNQKRGDLLYLANGNTAQENIVTPAEGRTLVYYPYATINDGAAELASYGYFDIDDVPPWDTWFWLDTDPSKMRGIADNTYVFYLLSWVPQPYIEYVEKAMASLVVDCLVYAEDSGLSILPELRNLGAIG